MELKQRTNGVWYVKQTTDTGRLIRKSMGTRDHAEAKRLAVEYLSGATPRLGNTYTVKQALNRVFKRKWEGLASEGNRDADVRFVGAYWGDTAVEAVTTRAAGDWIEVMESANLCAGTINRRVSALSMALSFACEERKLNVVPKLPRARVGRKKAPVYLKSREEEASLKAELIRYNEPRPSTGGIARLPEEGTVLILLTDVLILTGLRISELILCRRSDIVNRTLVLNEQKSGSPGSVPLSRAALGHLETLLAHPTWIEVTKATLKTNGSKDPKELETAYGWLHRRFTTAAHRAGLEKITLHKLRHTAASRMVLAGVPIYEVSKVLRHSKTEVTEIYAHLNADHLMSAVEKLEGYGSTAEVVSLDAHRKSG